MSEAIAFDTHRFVKRLTGGGFTEQQAEILAEEQVALLNANLATKADIVGLQADIARIEAGMDALRQETQAGMDALRQATQADIAQVEARMEARMEAGRANLLKWLYAAMIAQGGLIVALIKLLEP